MRSITKALLIVFLLDLAVFIHEALHLLAAFLVGASSPKMVFYVQGILVSAGATYIVAHNYLQEYIILILPAVILSAVVVTLLDKLPDFAELFFLVELSLLIPPYGDIARAMVISLHLGPLALALTVMVALSIIMCMLLALRTAKDYKSLCYALLIIMMCYLLPPIKIVI